jgi:hypothetical protein
MGSLLSSRSALLIRHIFVGFQKGEQMAITNTLAGRNLGMLLLGLWLILTGLLPLLNVKVSSMVTTGLAVLGIVAGILILLKR